MNEKIGTGIHTKVNEKYRISSIYRAYDTYAGTVHGWETILWRKGENGKEEIADMSSPRGDAQSVVNQHEKIFERIHQNNGEWKEEASNE